MVVRNHFIVHKSIMHLKYTGLCSEWACIIDLNGHDTGRTFQFNVSFQFNSIIRSFVNLV